MLYIFAAQGTLGDILPMLKLARCFHQAGHEVTFLTYSVFLELAEEYLPGSRCAGVCTEEQYNSMTGSAASWDASLCQSHHFESCGQFAIEPMFRIIHLLANKSPCTVVSTKNCHGALWACEKLSLHFVRISLSPYEIRSKIKLPFAALQNNTLSTLNAEPEEIARYWSMASGEYSSVYWGMLNFYRARLHLPPLTLQAVSELPPNICHVGFYPASFGMHDFSCENIQLVGFALNEPKLVKIKLDISSQHLPLVYSTGPNIPGDLIQYEHFVKVCLRVNRKGIFLCPNPRFLEKLHSHVVIQHVVDMEALLHNAAAIIHHGGIGTIADAIRAGIPQFILPRAFDQFDNANRVDYLRLGRRIAYHQFADTGLFSAQLNAELSQFRHLYELKKEAFRLRDENNPFLSAMGIIHSCALQHA